MHMGDGHFTPMCAVFGAMVAAGGWAAGLLLAGVQKTPCRYRWAAMAALAALIVGFHDSIAIVSIGLVGIAIIATSIALRKERKSW